MPFYDYKCKNPECGMEYEVFYTSIKEAEDTEKEETCPKCSSKDKEKLPSKNTGFQLKGRGWYRDGY